MAYIHKNLTYDMNCGGVYNYKCLALSIKIYCILINMLVLLIMSVAFVQAKSVISSTDFSLCCVIISLEYLEVSLLCIYLT